MAGACILVVEDHESLRLAIRDLLAMEGYVVLTAADGLEALSRLEEVCPDLIITDIMMPGMSGHELCARVRAHPEWASIPVVFLTAKAEKEDRQRGEVLGVDHYLVKPFNPQELLQVVRALLKTAGG